MVIYVYGEEEYLTYQKVQEIKKAYARTCGEFGNVVTFDCNEKCDVYEIRNTCAAQDLFAEKKLIIIKDFIQSTKVNEQKIMQEVITNTDTVVFWETGVPRKNASMVTWLNTHADDIYEGKKIHGKDLAAWIYAYVKKLDASIDKEAIDALILYNDNDLWRLAQELQKLATYALGRTITADDVYVLVHGKIDADMFTTIEALVAGDKKYAMTLLKKQLAKGDDPFHIFGMYAYQIRTLLLVGDASRWGEEYDKNAVAKIAGIHPFVVQKTLPLIKKFSQKNLTDAHRRLTILDQEVKAGKRDIYSALDLFVISI